MAWETRSNGLKYFYVSRRVGGRVVKDYYGCGPAALLASQQLDKQKQQRQAGRTAVQAAREQVATADAAIDQLLRASRIAPSQRAQPVIRAGF